jgi:hypothetical protein
MLNLKPPRHTPTLRIRAISSRAAERPRDYLGGGQSSSVGKTNGMTIWARRQVSPGLDGKRSLISAAGRG